MEYVARQGELNVPRPNRTRLPGHLLPVGERVPGEERDLDRARRPLPAAPREPRVEPTRPADQGTRLQPIRPVTQRLTPLGIEVGLLEESVAQRPDVEPGPADDDRRPPGAPHVLDPPGGVSREPAGAVTLADGDEIDAEMGDTPKDVRLRLGGADIQTAVHLARVGRDHREREMRGESHGERGFPRRRGSHDHHGSCRVSSDQSVAPPRPREAARWWAARAHHGPAGWP